jgi:phage terminase large subunit
VLDYEEHRAHGLEFYANLLREKSMKNEWVYGTHHWPHDGDHKNLATGQKLSFTARKLGIRPLRIQKRLKAEDGIQFVRQILKRCYFNYKEPSTSDVTGSQAGGTWRLVEALRQYRAELDEKSRTYSKKPLHDWTSHPADAMRTLAVSFMPTNKPDESYKTITEGRFHSPTQADLSWEP